MKYAIYVGRIGTLAVALGIGIAVAHTPGVAWAAPETGDDPSGISAQSPEQNDEGEGNPPDSGPLDGSDDSGDSDDSDDSDDSTGGMQVASSGGAITSTTTGSAGAKAADEDRDAGPPKRRLVAKSGSDTLQASSIPKKPKRSVLAAPAPPSRNAEGLDAKARSSALRVAPSDDQADQVVQPTRPVAEIAPQVRTAEDSPKVTASLVASPEPAPPTLMSRVLSLVTLTSTVGDAPPTPGEPPLLVGFLAAGRRVSQKASVEDESSLRVADSTETSLMMTALVANSAPVVAPSKAAPNENTGVIVGNVNATDAEGNPLSYTVSYTVTGQPTSGKVTVDGTGAFEYTPTQAARLSAGQTAAVDPDSFTISVSDGQGGITPVTVAVAVLPALVVSDPFVPSIPMGASSNPSSVAVYGNRTYVANATAKTVKVIDTDTNTVVATIPVQTSPSAIAVSPDGTAVWVANAGSKTVQRIDTQSNTVVATVTVGTTPTALAVTADSVWVANAGSNTVSRINTIPNQTTTNKVVATTTVGRAPSAIVVSGDRVYVANKSGNSISVISTSSNTVITTKSGVTAPSALAVTGGKLYVAQQTSNWVLVLNSSSMAQIATIAVQTAPTSIAISKDGDLAYVANSNDQVSIVDTKANTVISTVVIDDGIPTGGHAIALNDAGTDIYVTDAVDNTVRVLSLVRGNTAPVSTAGPTVGTPDPGTGAVTGSLNIMDWDQDSLSYTVTSQPTSTTVGITPTGTVTVNAAGTYTYVPNQTARDQAAQTPQADNTTFVVTVIDGRGGTGAVTVTAPISPLAGPPNQAPVATAPAITSRNTTTGVVTGSWNVTDADGNPLTYTVTGPTKGSVEIARQGDTYTYIYTPSQAERFAALNTAQADYDQFAVSVSDGRASTTVNVTVPVLPANIADTAFVTYLPGGSDPGSVTVFGDRAYVLNPGNNTVTILTSGQYPSVVATIPVDTTPTAVAVNSQYRRGYIGGNNAVTVINTDDNTKVATIPTGGGQVYGIAVSPDGSKVYVTNTTAGTVSVINPATNEIVGTIQTGPSPAGVAFTPDGKFAYLANMGANTVTVINAATNTQLASPIFVGISPANIAVSPDGKWAYVTNYGSNSVSYIDTATNTVVGSPLSVATKPYGITTSPDGSILYVASADGTTLYDAKTRRWISMIWSGDANVRRTSAVNRDGLFVYTTNSTEDLLRTTSIVRGNTTPIATAAPTVGTPDPVLGTVSGSLNVADPDLDPLNYRVTGPLTAGTVSFNYAAGTYTFTPTQAARDDAAQTQGPDYATFTVTADDQVYPDTRSIDVTVTVPIAPSGAAIPITTTAINVGPSPGKVVMSNGRAYVYNSANRTVMVINPATNQVTATIPVPAANDFVVRADGRIYVMGYDTVSVINPDGTQAVAPVRIPDLCEPDGCWGSSGGLTDIAINSAGTRVYVVRQYYIDTGTWSAVSMIDTADNTVVSTVGTYPLNDIEVTPDGTRIYAAESDYRVVPVLSAINLGSGGGVGITAPGEWPYVHNVSISPDGKRTYALVGGTAWAYDPPVSISVIDSDPTSSTYNTQIATIALPGAYDVAFSPDSSRAYVLMNDGKTVRIVNTATSAVIGYFTVPGANSIAVAPNGTVYLTNGGAGTVYAVTVGSATVV